jgi:GDP-4-dehydro-6-deoxy-D-mannose reductase
MRVLVTGKDGFVGPYLVAALHRAGHDVVGCAGPGAAPELRPLDLRDRVAVETLVTEVEPEAIVNLAGWASVGTSFVRPADCYEVNAGGAINLLEALRTSAPRARLLLISSGEVYGPRAALTLREESDVPNPRSPYAASKVAAESAAELYRRVYGLDVVVARPFNHLGRGQATSFVVPSFVAQLRSIASGDSEPIVSVGDLTPVRDFSSVLDVVEAYCVLLERGKSGETYNVCSGHGMSIADALARLAELLGVTVDVRTAPERLRPTELPHLVGEASRLRALGWEPAHDAFESALHSTATLHAVPPVSRS